MIVSRFHPRACLIQSLLLISLAAIFFEGVIIADTLHLTEDGDWKNVSNDPQSKYLLAAARAKRMIAAGEGEQAQSALDQLKADFPDIAGDGLNAFIAAELLYAEGKWVKAVRGYNEFLDTWPNSQFYEAAMERQFAVATAFLGGQKRRVLKILKLSAHEEGVKVMNQIADRTGDGPMAKRALLAVAKSYEQRGLYLDAYEAWAEIYSRWSGGEMGSNSLLAMAQSLHSAYKGPKYDDSAIISARSYYQNFKLRYPTLADKHQVDEKIKMIDEQLAFKQFEIGQYYNRTGNSAAANLYYQKVIDDWPKSTAAKMAKEKIAGKDEPQLPKGNKKFRKKLFDAGNTILDTWFGVTKLL